MEGAYPAEAMALSAALAKGTEKWVPETKGICTGAVMAKKLSVRAIIVEPVALPVRFITSTSSSKAWPLFWFSVVSSDTTGDWRRRCWVEICAREMEMDGFDGAKELQSGVDAITRRGRNLAREIILVLSVAFDTDRDRRKQLNAFQIQYTVEGTALNYIIEW